MKRDIVWNMVDCRFYKERLKLKFENKVLLLLFEEGKVAWF